MDIAERHPHSHMFTIRVWQEEMKAGQCEWRGKVQLLSSGEVRYFREWAALVPLLLSMLSELEQTTGKNE